MATIVTTIPDAQVNDVRDAFAALYGWTVDQGTKTAFTKKKVADYVKSVLKEHQANIAAAAARTSIDAIDIT